ncbi:hypothetical protein BGV71_19060 [Burkholderia ubonensis]|nr:hypothetical protein WI76_00695 [Burkholderia ubonensis]KVZ24805.1 hypothetical protein WL13_03370 [Burkholderia ubonensis]KWB12630.1 hypothetical protein WL33_12780 [Burkholderia ubonensis]KWC23219.1 hypothetical protein WL50_14775 [Burkholderia ubonensis]OJA75976.1 hypothetical protein BGV71_19060 [Burkholderia ubonensis]
MIVEIVSSCVDHQGAPSHIVELADTRRKNKFVHFAIHVRMQRRQITTMPVTIRSGVLLRDFRVPMPTRCASSHHLTVNYRRLTCPTFMHMKTVCASVQFFHLRVEQQAVRTFKDQDSSHLVAGTVGIDFIHRHGQLSRSGFV